MSKLNKKIKFTIVTKVDNKMKGEKLQKPFLKWVGGKTQIIKDIISKIPKEMDNYHELFLS